MLIITERDHGHGPIDDRLVLPFDQRQKSRLRVTLQSGAEAALMLERGGVLRGGDRLRSEDGRVIVVDSAPERVIRVTASSAHQLALAAYHLGNRHVPLQIGEGWLLLEDDHVLLHMLEGLGVSVTSTSAPFEPEGGAYGGHSPAEHHHHDHHHGHHHG